MLPEKNSDFLELENHLKHCSACSMGDHHPDVFCVEGILLFVKWKRQHQGKRAGLKRLIIKARSKREAKIA